MSLNLIITRARLDLNARHFVIYVEIDMESFYVRFCKILLNICKKYKDWLIILMLVYLNSIRYSFSALHGASFMAPVVLFAR